MRIYIYVDVCSTCNILYRSSKLWTYTLVNYLSRIVPNAKQFENAELTIYRASKFLRHRAFTVPQPSINAPTRTNKKSLQRNSDVGEQGDLGRQRM